MLLSTVAGVAIAADVQRGGDRPTFNPGVGGPSTVVVSGEKTVVFQGEEDINFVGPNGQPIDASNLIGVSGNAEGIPLESPIPQDQTLGQYAIDGRSQNIGVTVQRPRVTDLEVFNERGVDVEGASVQEDETLLVRAEWNYKKAEDLSLEVTDEDGNEITGDVLTDVEALSDAQREELTDAYAQFPEKVNNPGQRGTGTGIEYLQGLGQFESEQLQSNTTVDAAYWVLDLSDQDAGDYTITVAGWDELDFGAATHSTVISLETEQDEVLNLETDEATRGQNVQYVIRGSTAGTTHYVTIEDTDFRNNQVDEQVFRAVEDVVDRGTLDTNNNDESDIAWAQVEIDEDTGLGVGQLDTSYLDDVNVDVNLYETDKNLTEIAQSIGDTEDDRTLNVQEGTLSFDSPAGTYIAGQEMDVRGTAALGVDDVAIYVRDQGDWELVDISEDGQLTQQDFISVDADGEWEERDVRLSQANDILSIPGRYRIGVVEAVDVVQNGSVQQTLTTSEFSSATSEQTSIIVTEPTLGGGDGNSSLAVPQWGGIPIALQDQQNNTTQQDTNPTWVFKTYNSEIAVEDGTVEVEGVAPGLDEVLVVMVDTRGRIVTETVSVDDNDVFEEDDIELVTEDGRQLNEGQVRGMVFGLGRDTVVGDGVLPGQDQADIAALENWVQSFGAGLTQQQVTERILDETTDEAGSDDLLLSQTFRFADARTSVEAIVPQSAASQLPEPSFQRQSESIEVGQTMVVQGVTNRKPDDNSITVEVIDGPSAAEFDLAATDEWGRTGVWSVNLSVEGVNPGTYTLEVDDGDNTDIVQFRVVPEGEGQAQTETTTAEKPETTTTEGNEITAAEETTTVAENQSQEGEQLPNTLEIRSAGEPVNYSFTFDEGVELIEGTTEEGDTVSGNTVTGFVGVGETDGIRYAGELTDFTLEGNVTLFRNGEQIRPEALVNVTADNSSAVIPPAMSA